MDALRMTVSDEVPSTAAGAPTPPPPPPHLEQRSLSESLERLQGQAAFVPKPKLSPATSTTTKEHPPLPVAEAVEGDGEVFVAGLSSHQLFTGLPEHDAVSSLLEKYLPPNQRPQRDLSGSYQGRTLKQLVTERDWRGTARYAYDAIVSCPPDRTTYLLDHWSLRFYALFRLLLFDNLAIEFARVSSILPPFSVNSSSNEGSDADPLHTFHPVVPFAFHLFSASLPHLQGDSPASVERLTRLAMGAKDEYWRCKREGEMKAARIWKERGEQVGQILAETLSELQNGPSAVSILRVGASSPALATTLSRLQYTVGNIDSLSAEPDLSSEETRQGEAEKMRVLRLVGKGSWEQAEQELRRLLAKTPDDVELSNNLAVVLLYLARLDEAIEVLQTLLITQPVAAYSNETVLFNLTTLVELRSEDSMRFKVGLLRSAAEVGGQELPSSCFKLVL
ncbi:hypothetical protein JCM10212_001328 [Sporobolomyces blumeae]